jgi:hypothetical protein
MDQAFATPGPVIVEALTDPNELPMPPQLKAEEIANVREALAKGQPDAAEIASLVSRTNVRQMI